MPSDPTLRRQADPSPGSCARQDRLRSRPAPSPWTRIRGLVIAGLMAALMLLPIPAQGFDNIDIVGDLDQLVKRGQEFKIAINPKTGKAAVISIKQFHDDAAALVGSNKKDIIRGLIKPNAQGSWKFDVYPGTAAAKGFPAWEKPEHFARWLGAFSRNPKAAALVNAATTPGLQVTLNGKDMKVTPPSTPGGKWALVLGFIGAILSGLGGAQDELDAARREGRPPSNVNAVLRGWLKFIFPMVYATPEQFQKGMTNELARIEGMIDRGEDPSVVISALRAMLEALGRVMVKGIPIAGAIAGDEFLALLDAAAEEYSGPPGDLDALVRARAPQLLAALERELAALAQRITELGQHIDRARQEVTPIRQAAAALEVPTRQLWEAQREIERIRRLCENNRLRRQQIDQFILAVRDAQQARAGCEGSRAGAEPRRRPRSNAWRRRWRRRITSGTTARSRRSPRRSGTTIRCFRFCWPRRSPCPSRSGPSRS